MLPLMAKPAAIALAATDTLLDCPVPPGCLFLGGRPPLLFCQTSRQRGRPRRRTVDKIAFARPPPPESFAMKPPPAANGVSPPPPSSKPTARNEALDKRIRELDDERDPLSLPEEIVSEATRGGGRVGIPQPNADAPATSLTVLQRTPHADLLDLAAAEGLSEYAGLPRQELVFRLLKSRMKANGLMYGEGTLEVLPDGFGFLRSAQSHYLACPDDIYVSPSQIRRFGLHTGSHVAGQIRPPKENERYFALLRIEAINQTEPAKQKRRVPFDDLTPMHPDRRIDIAAPDATGGDALTGRLVDLMTPIGYGQRGLIVSPQRAGKTRLMQQLAHGVLQHPEVHVLFLLIDERPEEVTEMQRQMVSDRCEVISSTFDEPPERHIQVASMVIERAKRMVEAGRDVVIFLDSLTRLTRAFAADEESQTGRLMTGGLDAGTLQKPKAIFGAARRIEQGGSLTILATALIETGNRMDEVIFEEFKGTGNLEIVLDGTLAARRLYPAINLPASGTRHEELLLSGDELSTSARLRDELADLTPADSLRELLGRLAQLKS